MRRAASILCIASLCFYSETYEWLFVNKSGTNAHFKRSGLINEAVDLYGVTLLHTIGGEDLFVQQWLQDKPCLWESGNWSEPIGVEVAPREGRGWEECRKAHVCLAPIMEYQEAVRSATADYISSLAPKDLDRKIMVFGREQTLANVMVIVVNHVIVHMGEIAALKGILGVKGLPF